jgi:hypothetical protein
MKRIVVPLLVLAALGAGAETLPEPTGPGDLVPPIVLEVGTSPRCGSAAC